MAPDDETARAASAHPETRTASGAKRATSIASQAVRHVSEALDEELEESIVRVPPEEPLRRESPAAGKPFEEVLFNLTNDAHDLIDIISDGADAFCLAQAEKIVRGVRKSAHKGVDVLSKIALMTPSVIEEVIQENEERKKRR